MSTSSLMQSPSTTYYKNKDIYFVGITNSGKSTLINAMIKSYNGYDGDITMSNFPSTTLDVIVSTDVVGTELRYV